MTTPDSEPLGEIVPRIDEAAQEAARARQLRLTKPAGALGRLEELSIWLAGVQGAARRARSSGPAW